MASKDTYFNGSVGYSYGSQNPFCVYQGTSNGASPLKYCTIVAKLNKSSYTPYGTDVTFDLIEQKLERGYYVNGKVIFSKTLTDPQTGDYIINLDLVPGNMPSDFSYINVNYSSNRSGYITSSMLFFHLG